MGEYLAFGVGELFALPWVNYLADDNPCTLHETTTSTILTNDCRVIVHTLALLGSKLYDNKCVKLYRLRTSQSIRRSVANGYDIESNSDEGVTEA